MQLKHVCEHYEVKRQNGRETETFWNMPEHILQASSVAVMYTVISASLFFLWLIFNKDKVCLGTGF